MIGNTEICEQHDEILRRCSTFNFFNSGFSITWNFGTGAYHRELVMIFLILFYNLGVFL